MPAVNPQRSRSPELSVFINDTTFSGAIEAKIVSTNYYSCDWFEVSFVPSGTGPFDVPYWLSVKNPAVDVRIASQAGLPSVSLITGHADSVSVDPVRHIVTVAGRDLSALLVDSTIHRSFPNQSAGEIATILALYHGLNPKVLPTPDLVGRRFAGAQDLSIDGYYARTSTDWDMIVRLAAQYGYDAYVQGKDLYFQPVGRARGAPIVVEGPDFLQLRVTRSFAMERATVARQVSWNSQLQQEISSTVQPIGLGSSSGSISALEPNLDPTRLGATISRLTAGLKRQSVGIQATMLGETKMTARSRLSLRNIGPGIDGFYDVESIDRTFSAAAGFLQRIRAVRSPSS